MKTKRPGGCRGVAEEVLANDERHYSAPTEARIKAQILAAEMVTTAGGQRGRRMHFSIIARRHELVPFPVHWKHKNSRGVSFAKADVTVAVEWVAIALLAGYGVCLHWGNRRSGGGVYSLREPT
jgi:hypothetical protein